MIAIAVVGVLAFLVFLVSRYLRRPLGAAAAGVQALHGPRWYEFLLALILLLGTGCLFLTRHRSSLGGATVVSLYLQGRYGMRAGKVQMMIDGTVVLLALFVVPVERVAYSVLAVLVMSGFLWISHRPGRYVGH